jgi:iron complex outermembrane recepter protein
MKYWKSGRYGLAFTTALALGTIPAFGQDVTTTANAPVAATPVEANASDEDVVELSPFVVETSKDVGYMATNAISGTRLNMAIKDVPLNLEVITAKFIQDTGATNLRESLRYSAGLVLSSQSDAFADPDTNDLLSAGSNDARGVTRTAGDSATKLRGFTGSYMLQDGFHRNFSADTVNIERIEVLRGPSALLYGTGNFGGVVNYISKKPIFDKNMTHVGVTVGSYNLLRSELDINMPLADADSWLAKYKPAFRMTASTQSNKNYTDFYKQEFWTVNPSLSFKPFKDTTVIISGEVGYKDESGTGFQNIRANTTQAGSGTTGGNGTGASRAASWATDLFSTVDGSVIGHKVNNRTFRWSGDDTYIKGPYRNITVDLEQQIMEDMYLKVGFSHSHYEFNTRTIDASITADNSFDDYTSMWYGTDYTGRATELDSRFISGSSYGDVEAGTAPEYTNIAVIRYRWRDVNQANDRDQVRAELMYRKDLGVWGTHTMVTGVSYEKIHTVTDLYQPASTWTGTDGTHYIPWYDEWSYKDVEDLTPIEYGVQGDGVPDNPQVHWQTTTDDSFNLGYYAVYQGQFLNDKLTLIGGVRWDRCDERNVVDFVYAYDEASQYNNSDAQSTYSPQVGVSYQLLPQLSAFAVFSTGASPNFNVRDGNNQNLPVTKARNIEAGIKFDLFKNTLSGTVSVYHIEREGVPYYVWWAPNVYSSVANGYDSTEDTRQVVWYASPAAFYYALHRDDMTVDEAVAEAKKIWPEGWWPLIDEIANSTHTLSTGYTDSDFVDFGPISAGPNGTGDWWNSDCYVLSNANTGNPDYTGDYYFPLVNFSDPDVLDFFNPILTTAGWKANYYSTQGATYLMGDGTQATANTASSYGAYVQMDDVANGWDAQITWTPFEELQIVASFSHLVRKVTTDTYHFVDAAFCPGAMWLTSDNAYGTLNNTLSYLDVYTDPNDASTYHGSIPIYNQAADDSPENAASIWAHYELSHVNDVLKGWAVGAGAQWEDKRMWFTGFTGGGANSAYVTNTRTLIQYWTDPRTTINCMVEYKTRILDKYDLRFAINVDNIMDDKKAYGLVYADGRSWRFSTSVDF